MRCQSYAGLLQGKRQLAGETYDALDREAKGLKKQAVEDLEVTMVTVKNVGRGTDKNPG